MDQDCRQKGTHLSGHAEEMENIINVLLWESLRALLYTIGKTIFLA
jgi:hypothetical protein